MTGGYSGVIFAKKRGNIMEQHDFVVSDIQGDYAYLTQTDAGSAEPFQVALALLPAETDIGTKLRGFMGMFEVID